MCGAHLGSPQLCELYISRMEKVYTKTVEQTLSQKVLINSKYLEGVVHESQY